MGWPTRSSIWGMQCELELPPHYPGLELELQLPPHALRWTHPVRSLDPALEQSHSPDPARSTKQVCHWANTAPVACTFPTVTDASIESGTKPAACMHAVEEGLEVSFTQLTPRGAWGPRFGKPLPNQALERMCLNQI